MKIPQHTPGPWKIGNGVYGIGNIPVHAVQAQDGKPIANCGSWRDAAANARIIAAAPDLLSALEKIAIGLSPNSVAVQRENIAELLHDCAIIAQDAIAKAKGETL